MYDCVFQSNAKWLHNREINLHQDRSCKSFFVKELCTICGASFPRNCVFVGDEKKGKSKNKIYHITQRAVRGDHRAAFLHGGRFEGGEEQKKQAQNFRL